MDIVKALIERDGKFLLLHRPKDKKYKPDHWDFPGGKVDKGEDLKTALRREIREETALKVNSIEELRTFDEKEGDIEFTLILYRCETEGEIFLNEEHTEYRWVKDISSYKTMPYIRTFFKYRFVEYDDNYPKIFQKEKEILGKLLPNAHIEHVGSTAVPGLGGKGIIDIAVGVDKLTTALEGYEYRETASTKTRKFFRKDISDQRIHIHLVIYKEKDWKEMLDFRDSLLDDPKKREEYAKLKRDAVLIA